MGDARVFELQHEETVFSVRWRPDGGLTVMLGEPGEIAVMELSVSDAERFMLWVDAGNPHPGERD